jgi:hypothetical protein
MVYETYGHDPAGTTESFARDLDNPKQHLRRLERDIFGFLPLTPGGVLLLHGTGRWQVGRSGANQPGEQRDAGCHTDTGAIEGRLDAKPVRNATERYGSDTVAYMHGHHEHRHTSAHAIGAAFTNDVSVGRRYPDSLAEGHRDVSN